jgi:hypothetical protein
LDRPVADEQAGARVGEAEGEGGVAGAVRVRPAIAGQGFVLGELV